MRIWRDAGLTILNSDSLEEIIKLVDHDPELFLVAVREEVIVGAAIGGWDGRRGYIYHYATEPSLQRQGIGTALLQQLEQRLTARGCIQINLVAYKSNIPAIAHYKNLGFTPLDYMVVLIKKLNQ